MRAIDLFAGAGGFTAGAAMAGVAVVWAADHWQLAVDVHSANHPDTSHACQDLQQANWMDVPAHDLLLSSPACQGHSRARGKERPRHDAARSTAWAVVSCAEYHRPRVVIVENVAEFSTWLLYPSWCDAMRRLGYALALHVLDAADHGVPQHRKRIYIVATRSRSPLFLSLPVGGHRPVLPLIEWNRYRWSPIETENRSPRTLSRIANGRRRFGDCFLFPYFGSGSGLTGRDLNRPIGTITTRAHWALVGGDRMRMLQPSRSEAVHLLGNAVCPPVARDLINEILRVA